jgi:hypothetical protein
MTQRRTPPVTSLDRGALVFNENINTYTDNAESVAVHGDGLRWSFVQYNGDIVVLESDKAYWVEGVNSHATYTPNYSPLYDHGFTDGGDVLWMLESENGALHKYTLGTAYDIGTRTEVQSLDYSSRGYSAYSFSFSPDGTVLHICNTDAPSYNRVRPGYGGVRPGV